jgi:catechol 2,3-dioxygenase-like lactoylglutathione lyase family enzyme
MMKQMTTGAVHHLTLTVTEVNRARTFYTELLGFQQVAEYGPRMLLSNGSVILALGPALDPQQAICDDCFDKTGVGLKLRSASSTSTM